ncbi:MAG: ferritin-like domain-containing protein [Prochlorococcaceae cyanobacterium]
MVAVHARVLALLGRALSLELSAVQQYMTQSALAERWGDQLAAERFRLETVEELRHAERLVQRMLALGVAPAASQLRPVTTAGDLLGLLRQNAQLEALLVDHYAEAVRFCQLIGDHDNGTFFRELLNDEQLHGEDLAQWLGELGGGRAGDMDRATF